MRFARLTWLTVLALVVPFLSACRSTQTAGANHVPPAVLRNPGGLSTDDIARLEEAWRARIDSSRMRFTEADARFMAGMIGHHAQALGMSNLAPTNGASPTIRTLASRIINAQTDEIALMQAWLRVREQAVPEVHVDGWKVMVHGGGDHGHHHGQMPGMLTDAQMQQLASARGAEFDKMYLTFMIQHHQGAVVMVEELFATDGAGQDEDVFKFASDVQVDQRTEIARMQRMLDELASS